MQMKSDEDLAKGTPEQLAAEFAKAVQVSKEYAAYAAKLKDICLRGAFQYTGPYQLVKGTRYCALSNGTGFKAVFVLKHKLLKSGDELDDIIKQIERLDGGVLAESLFKYNVELAGSTFEKLAKDHKARAILNGSVEIKSAVQSLQYGALPDKEE
jgi:hypothetical protein